MTKQEPPNLRKADACITCEHMMLTKSGISWCKKHDYYLKLDLVCDDYVREME
jgi:hypothetical protein